MINRNTYLLHDGHCVAESTYILTEVTFVSILHQGRLYDFLSYFSANTDPIYQYLNCIWRIPGRLSYALSVISCICTVCVHHKHPNSEFISAVMKRYVPNIEVLAGELIWHLHMDITLSMSITCSSLSSSVASSINLQ